MLESCGAVLLGVAIGIGAHLWLGPAGAATPAPVAEVAGASLDRSAAAPPAVADAARGAVVEVRARGCGARRQASAVVTLDRDGRPVVLTNRHVVKGASRVQVVLPGGRTEEVAVLGGLAGRDAALLDPTPLLAGGVEPLEPGAPAGVGDAVVVAGHPAGEFRVDATVVADAQRRAAYGGSSEVLLAASAAEGGHSGGAVLDGEGALVGLVAARDPGTGRAVAYRLEELLGVPLTPSPGC